MNNIKSHYVNQSKDETMKRIPSYCLQMTYHRSEYTMFYNGCQLLRWLPLCDDLCHNDTKPLLSCCPIEEVAGKRNVYICKSILSDSKRLSGDKQGPQPSLIWAEQAVLFGRELPPTISMVQWPSLFPTSQMVWLLKMHAFQFLFNSTYLQWVTN